MTDIETSMAHLFRRAAWLNENYQDGMESLFTRDLMALLESEGPPAFEALEKELLTARGDECEEVMAWLQAINRKDCEEHIKRILRFGLKHEDGGVQDKAVSTVWDRRYTELLDDLKAMMKRQPHGIMQEYVQDAIWSLQEDAGMVG